jgi:hypothetical protein
MASRRELTRLAVVAAGAPGTASRAALAPRMLGGLGLLVVGGVHLEQYTVAHFDVIPTIGPLFLVNFVVGTSLGVLVLASLTPLRRHTPPLLDALIALAGIGVAAGALTALLISEHTPLFGFMEHGYRLEIVVAIAAEAVAIAALAVVAIGSARKSHRSRSRRRPVAIERPREEPA